MNILLFLGFVFVGLAMVGVFIPLMPTTPFLLLAMWCFARSNPKYQQWVMENRLLGPYVRGYTNGFTRTQVVRTLVLMWGVMSISGIFATSSWWVRGVLFLIGCGVTCHILLRAKSQKKSN